MAALAVAAIICWLMVLVARPRTPLPGNEVQELVYARLLGRQHLLAILALLVTAVTLLVLVTTLPQRIDPDLRTIRQTRAACVEARHEASDARDYGGVIRPHCYDMQPGGTWAERVEQPDGTWLVVATLAGPPLLTRSTAAQGSGTARSRP